MLEAGLRGFALGLSLIVAIGAQNAFILERGLVRSHVFVLCLVCALADALLIAAGVAGLGTLIAARPGLIFAVTIGGALFLAAYAAIALRRALRPDAMVVRGGRAMSLKTALATVLALTFLNPHVYLDTVVLLGSLSARYPEEILRVAYGSGAMAASFLWFFALGYGARLLAPLFARPSAWRILDAVIAAVMALLALSLLASLL
ncbi:LysE/ArgO family amino acid transporter [Aureimonas glaciei]|uniref:Amino acid transporter n=1 Tax=Aureimonas glaciei TaxID=1776957 RepID=A0A916XV12_9HYPH|nr:LysE/ArgO family amino acid transporter [Aureimonas glaciei]GGD13653.1 amino acid transporter [Aureimonas glaciei]